MMTLVRRAAWVGGVCLAVAVGGCKEEGGSPSSSRRPPSAQGVTAIPGQRRFDVAPGSSATFLIDAPLEKIKGRVTKVQGTLAVNPDNLKASTGHVEVDLDDLRTETFEDADKNKSQTEHAKNWFEIGSEVEAKQREGNRRALFTIKTVDEANPVRLAAATVDNGERTVDVRATGDLWIHGASSLKTVNLRVTFAGSPDAPTSLHLVTTQPILVSLKEHDVKPRDFAGKFLAGALEKVGQKIDDKVQVSLDVTAKAH